MGQMSSALAHELNQPLMAILSYVKAATRIIETSPDQQGLLREVLSKTADQTVRAGDIIRRLRAFVEKRDHTRTPEDINLVAKESIALGLSGVRDSGVTLKLYLSEGLPRVNVDKVEIQQVLINLMRNAAEAMQNSTVRDLTVSTAIDGGSHVVVAIKDTGPDLSEDVAQRLFQPFVTTKAEGMGMGLNICRTIVEAHGGRLWAEPNSTSGMTFQFRLPAHAITDHEDDA